MKALAQVSTATLSAATASAVLPFNTYQWPTQNCASQRSSGLCAASSVAAAERLPR